VGGTATRSRGRSFGARGVETEAIPGRDDAHFTGGARADGRINGSELGARLALFDLDEVALDADAPVRMMSSSRNSSTDWCRLQLVIRLHSTTATRAADVLCGGRRGRHQPLSDAAAPPHGTASGWRLHPRGALGSVAGRALAAPTTQDARNAGPGRLRNSRRCDANARHAGMPELRRLGPRGKACRTHLRTGAA